MAMARKHTLLVIDHDMTFVRQIASKVTVLHEGRLLCQGSMKEVQNNPKVIEVYLGQHKEEHSDHHLTNGVAAVPSSSAGHHVIARALKCSRSTICPWPMAKRRFCAS